jgi:hypothetical protein
MSDISSEIGLTSFRNTIYVNIIFLGKKGDDKPETQLQFREKGSQDAVT